MSFDFNLDSIPRSASYTQFPATTGPEASFERNDIKRTFSENLIANPKTNTFRHASIKRSSPRTIQKDERNGVNGCERRQPYHTKFGPKITVSGFQVGADEEDADFTYRDPHQADVNAAGAQSTLGSVSGSLARLKRQSWIVSSQSSSPNKRKPPEQRPNAADGTTSSDTSSSLSTAVGDLDLTNVLTDDGHRAEQIEVKRRKSRRPISSYLSMTSLSETPKIPSLPKSFSTDKLPLSDPLTSTEKPPSIPSSKSFERLNAVGTESPRRKDELWSAFRSLDADFQKFQSRPSSMKCAIVRTTLLPFLRNHSEALPNSTLRPEDLDRRINVLNRWWTGLLEMINGRNGESVSGSDRPTVLDAITAIMIRPEWNMTPSTSPSRSPKPSLKSRSTTSLRSTTSDFLTESVIHNIKNTYVQNLLAQMAFAVNKLSVRSVPASVVAFCGKSIAYAFFYCDGVAEILVRLWMISPDALKRALVASGIERTANMSLASESISARFPNCVRRLSFSSSRLMIRYLRSRPQLPIATMYIPWDGPWTARWAGRDTDLFYSFTKQYYDLLSKYLPEDASKEEIFCAPGHALLQAQILSLLDTAVLHSGSQPQVDTSKGPSFGDVLDEADASAAVLPISPNTMTRSMAENRLIMLLRDCLSANVTITPRARIIFADVFEKLLKATASRTSQFDHLACFTLCDLLEEAIVIFVRFHQNTDLASENFDWTFWIRVCQLMMASNNSMTEIRLCTFLYSLWNTIMSDEERKRDICLGWLLRADVFGRQFNHWCPMVRAYFMRLLVWRFGRLDGNASDLDLEILRTLSQRLHQAWCTFIYIKDVAERTGSALPATAPCSPAPSRCLLIIRNEAPAPPTYLSFDSILPPSQINSVENANQRSSLFGFPAPPQPASKAKENEESSRGGKRRWGLLKNIIPFTNSPAKRSSASPMASKPSHVPVVASSKSDNPGPMNLASQPLPTVTEYRTHSFKFSLEWMERGQLPSRDRTLYPPKLPLPAQLYLQSGHNERLSDTPLKPEGSAIGESKYVGRALAEWALLVAECSNFFERRKQEGVPDNSKVETPTLGVEPFRKS